MHHLYGFSAAGASLLYPFNSYTIRRGVTRTSPAAADLPTTPPDRLGSETGRSATNAASRQLKTES
jgi:hypothetical protein